MRVDLVDPGSEGLALRAVLRAGGLDVESRELSDLLETSAEVVVLAGDTPGALEALRRLRDDGARPDVPVVLVGAPPGLEPRSDGPAFGAEWTLGRDAAPDRLVRIVREVAARAVVLGVPRGLRERTLDLGREESQVARVSDDGQRRVARVSDVAPAPGPEPGSGEIALRAPISLELEAILRAGAARAFPNADDVDVSLPAGEDSARDLVPDEFVAVGSSDEEESPGDSLTFVGGPAPLAEVRPSRTPAPGGARRTTAGANPSDEPPRPSHERTRSALPTGSSLPPRPQLGVRTIKDRSALTTGAESSAAGEGSLLEFLRAIFGIVSVDDERGVRVRAGTETLELAFAAGALTFVRGAIASRALVALGQRAAKNEGEAEARIEALVLGGLVSPTRRARAVEAQTRASLDALFRERRIEWLEIPPPETRSGRVLPQSLERELSDAAARVVSRQRAAELLGGATSRVVRAGGWERGATSSGISTALDAALAGTGIGLSRLWAALEDEPGLAGRLVALVAIDALEVRGLDTDVPEDLAARARARALVEEARRRADDGDYFAVLGLGPSAGAEQVSAAFSLEGERLLALDLDALGLGALASDRDIALGALAEARRVLSKERWRAAYAAAIQQG